MQFKLWSHIHLSTSVTKVRPGSNGGHIVEYINDGKASEWACDAIAVCSGLHVTPNIPIIDGIGNVPTVIHSSEFKERKQFGVDKNVLIAGSGETGMDIAYLAITSPTKSVTLCHRDGFLCAPKVLIFGQLLPDSLLNMLLACSRAVLLRHETYLVSTGKCPLRCRRSKPLRYRLRSSIPPRLLFTLVLL
jgi:cation diffusion facilitator CzcD-associated flavoprotein CzcO